MEGLRGLVCMSWAGDTHIDDHHTIEDTAIVIGKTLQSALGDRRCAESCVCRRRERARHSRA
eukprot:7071799-Pyramimonas_sp.AAC.1